MSHESATLWVSFPAEPVAARIALAGDFLPARNLEFRDGCDWREMARDLDDYFDDIDASFVNLECCLETGGLPSRPLSGLGDIVSAPAESLDYLAAIRTCAASLANNHSYDFGSAGVARTRAEVARCGITPLGAGRTFDDPPEVFIWKGAGDVRIGFWTAATATLDAAAPGKFGVEPASTERARQACRALHEMGARFCIALLHAGCLRTNRPEPEQARLMDSIAKCGFDIVAASHSHRIGGYRQLNWSSDSRSFCFYGLGSLVSGFAASELEREGLIVVAGFNRSGKMICLEVQPVSLGATGFGAIPLPLAGRQILERFCALSDEIVDGSYERLFYRDMSDGLLRLYARDVRAAFRADGIRGVARKATRVRARHVRRLVHKVIG